MGLPHDMRRFDCCTTTWRIEANGPEASHAVKAAEALVRALERRLNAFDPRSAVAVLNATGKVEDEHVAHLVLRAQEYSERTHGVFDIREGLLEHRVKDYLRGTATQVTVPCLKATVVVRGDRVTTDSPIDLNGIAKGYIVDRAHEMLMGFGGTGFVDGGGDIAGPTGPVAIASPYDDEDLGVLDTRWNVATSGNARRRRGRIDHIYDPRDGHVGARHDQVTVLAKRDCVEADVLATSLAASSLQEGYDLVANWPGVEAFWVHEGRQWATEGFAEHVWRP